MMGCVDRRPIQQHGDRRRQGNPCLVRLSQHARLWKVDPGNKPWFYHTTELHIAIFNPHWRHGLRTPHTRDWGWLGQPLQEGSQRSTARRGTQWEGSQPMRWQHSDHGSQHLGKQHQHGRQHHQRSYPISQRGDKLEVDLWCWCAAWPYNNVACRWSTTAPSVGPCQHSETLVGMHHAVATDNANTQGTSGSRQ